MGEEEKGVREEAGAGRVEVEIRPEVREELIGRVMESVTLIAQRTREAAAKRQEFAQSGGVNLLESDVIGGWDGVADMGEMCEGEEEPGGGLLGRVVTGEAVKKMQDLGGVVLINIHSHPPFTNEAERVHHTAFSGHDLEGWLKFRHSNVLGEAGEYRVVGPQRPIEGLVVPGPADTTLVLVAQTGKDVDVRGLDREWVEREKMRAGLEQTDEEVMLAEQLEEETQKPVRDEGAVSRITARIEEIEEGKEFKPSPVAGVEVGRFNIDVPDGQEAAKAFLRKHVPEKIDLEEVV